MKQAEYRKTYKGDGYQFQVTPAPKIQGGCAGILFKLMIALLPAFVFGGIGMSQDNALSLVMAIVVPIVLFIYLLKWDMRNKNHRNPSSFFVSPNIIELNGHSVAKSSIHRIIIRNAYDKTPKVQLTGQPVSTGVGMGYDMRNALEQISYSVDIEAGGRATQLAGGMDEITANGLFTEVSQILGL